MKLFFDNTGVQAALRAFLGKSNPATPEYDAEALLQFFVASLFSDRIYVNGFEADFIRDRTFKSCAELNKLLLNETVFVLDVDLETYRRSCIAAADLAALELGLSNCAEFGLHRSELIELPRTGPQRIIDSMNLTSLPEGHRTLLEIQANSLEREKAIATVEFMFATSDELRTSLRSLTQTKKWSHAHTVNLHSFLRYRLNCELSATTKSAFYTPSPDRAHLLRHIPVSFANPSDLRGRLDCEIELISDQGRVERVNDLPVLVGFLLSQSGGRLDDLARIVRELRMETALLRSELAEIQSKSPAEQQALIGSYGRVIRQALGLVEPPKKKDLQWQNVRKNYGIREAVMFVLSYSRFFSEEIKANKAWNEFMAEKTKLSVITEAIAWRPDQENLTIPYRQFLKEITRNQ